MRENGSVQVIPISKAYRENFDKIFRKPEAGYIAGVDEIPHDEVNPACICGEINARHCPVHNEPAPAFVKDYP